MNTLVIDTSAKVVATRKFTMAGKEYLSGEPVDLSDLDQRTVIRLYQFRYIVQAPVAEPTPPQEPEAPVAEPTPPQEPEAPVAPTSQVLTLNHKGGGYYELVKPDGSLLLEDTIKGKDNAVLIAQQQGFEVKES